MNWHKVQAKFRRTLAYLYPSKESILPLLRDAGIPEESISGTTGNEIWSDALLKARKRGLLEDVLQAALSEYPDHRDLKKLLALTKYDRDYKFDNSLFDTTGALDGICTEVQLSELCYLLEESQIELLELLETYWGCVPVDWQPLQHAKNVQSIVRNLSYAPVCEGCIHPLFQFVHHFATHFPEASKPLHQWMQEVALLTRQPSAVAISRAKREDEAPFFSAQPYVLIKLENDEFNPRKFKIEGWFFCNTTGCKADNDYEALDVTDFSYTLKNVSLGIEDLIYQAYRCMVQRQLKKELIVELFIPENLLNYDIYQFIMHDLDDTPIPLAYPTVVRLLDRVYCDAHWNARMYFQWHSKWDQLQQKKENMRLRCYDYYEKLLRPRIGEEICLALTFVPPIQKRARASNIFSVILTEGIPVSLWPRKSMYQHDGEGLKSIFEVLNSENAFSNLPEALFRKRRAFLEDEGHLIHSLNLLWDDPDRLPPDVETDAILLKAPVKARMLSHE